MKKMQGRIRFEENWMNDGKGAYVFEFWSEVEKDWLFETAYIVVDGRVSENVFNHMYRWEQLGMNYKVVKEV